jgi:hypothetical protein
VPAVRCARRPLCANFRSEVQDQLDMKFAIRDLHLYGPIVSREPTSSTARNSPQARLGNATAVATVATVRGEGDERCSVRP